MEKIDFKGKFSVEPYIPSEDGLLYKYFSPERGVEAITSHTLYFSPTSKLNDSYELDIDRVKFTMSDENIQSLLIRYFPDNEALRKRIFQKSKYTRKFVPSVLQKELQKIREKCGICCFTTQPHNLLMWASYGVSDTGVCIGFDLPILSSLSHELFLMKVIYEEVKSSIDYFQKANSIFPFWAFVKNSAFAYEQEVRAINMNYNGLIEFQLSDIKEIHYGMKSSIDTRGKIESYLALKNSFAHKSFVIEKSSTDYKLNSKPI